MSVIECHTLYGSTKLVPREKLILRPAAYAIIVNDGKVLLVKMRSTGKWCLPGGGIDAGERIEDALRREVREETGIEIRIETLVLFKEDFFYYDPADKAIHGLLFFYFCKPETCDLLRGDQIDDDEAERPSWIEVQSLQEHDIQSHGETILEILRSHQIQ